jgi:hypothetical protein
MCTAFIVLACRSTGYKLVYPSAAWREGLQGSSDHLRGYEDYFFLKSFFHPIPWWDSISQSMTPQAETKPLDHIARA